MSAEDVPLNTICVVGSLVKVADGQKRKRTLQGQSGISLLMVAIRREKEHGPESALVGLSGQNVGVTWKSPKSIARAANTVASPAVFERGKIALNAYLAAVCPEATNGEPQLRRSESLKNKKCVADALAAQQAAEWAKNDAHTRKDATVKVKANEAKAAKEAQMPKLPSTTSPARRIEIYSKKQIRARLTDKELRQAIEEIGGTSGGMGLVAMRQRLVHHHFPSNVDPHNSKDIGSVQIDYSNGSPGYDWHDDVPSLPGSPGSAISVASSSRFVQKTTAPQSHLSKNISGGGGSNNTSSSATYRSHGDADTKLKISRPDRGEHPGRAERDVWEQSPADRAERKPKPTINAEREFGRDDRAEYERDPSGRTNRAEFERDRAEQDRYPTYRAYSAQRMRECAQQESYPARHADRSERVSYPADCAGRAERESSDHAERAADRADRERAADRAERDRADRSERERADRAERERAADRADRERAADRAERDRADRAERERADRTERERAADRAERDRADRAERERGDRAERERAERAERERERECQDVRYRREYYEQDRNSFHRDFQGRGSENRRGYD